MSSPLKRSASSPSSSRKRGDRVQEERRTKKEESRNYGLLDETTDLRYPQYMGARILNEFIKTDAYRMEVIQMPPMAVTSSS
ncbi:unnamed protein product [Eruca vesicaria subsp. sativa]|uniref:Uncharacterized protein n=1 Tax=Eruca vesicaria subsp. sativa TaxID=29727 RepID=A0ABC8KZB8_ERUVS|nr:unnamed protein product [Eruca vesicaria subsp. sativa]